MPKKASRPARAIGVGRRTDAQAPAFTICYLNSEPALPGSFILSQPPPVSPPGANESLFIGWPSAIFCRRSTIAQWFAR